MKHLLQDGDEMKDDNKSEKRGSTFRVILSGLICFVVVWGTMVGAIIAFHYLKEILFIK